MNVITQQIEENLNRNRQQSTPEPQRTPIRNFAQNLSMGALAHSHAMNCNDAMKRWLEMAWQHDGQGFYYNVDMTTGEFAHRFAVPTGSKYKRWGMSKTEALVLRRYLMQWQRQPRISPVFVFDEISRRWYVNIYDYKTYQDCLSILQRCSISAARYLELKQQISKEQKQKKQH